MKKLKQILSIASCFIAGAVMANADDLGRWYLEGKGNVMWHRDLEVNRNVAGVEGVTQKHDYKVGGGGALSIGAIIDCWRVEIEGAYGRNKLDKITQSQPNVNDITQNATGYYEQWTIMGNIFYDIPVVDDFGIYLGIGAGIAFQETEVVSETASLTTKFKTEDTLFVVQGMPGIYYNVSDCVTFTLGYKIKGTSKPKLSKDFEVKKVPVTHAIEAGIRLKF